MSGHADDLLRHVGRRIVAARPLTDLEVAAEGWKAEERDRTAVLILDDGTALIPFSDPEGSGPGHLRSGRVVGWTRGPIGDGR